MTDSLRAASQLVFAGFNTRRLRVQSVAGSGTGNGTSQHEGGRGDGSVDNLLFYEVPFTGGNTVENVGEWRMRERVLLSQTTHHLRERCWLTHLHLGVILRFVVDVTSR